ncbi:CDP-alcohol phosphatidyltransferase family protein [Propioniferax innocua]
MLHRLRHPVGRLVGPLADGLNRIGVSPDVVTIVGTGGVVVTSLLCLPRGWLVSGALIAGFFASLDVIDGAMARRGGRVSRWGAVLDASCDRLADGAILGGLVLYLAVTADEPVWSGVMVWALICAVTIPYVNARAEASGLPTVPGLATRADRLFMAGVGTLLAGVGVAWALPAAAVVLAVMGTITVAQRLHAARGDV